MDFDQGPISKHLALQAQQYRIPDFQRSYSWTATEWRTLWVDILRQYREVKPGWESAGPNADIEARTAHMKHVPTHYLGAIVTANPVTVTPPRSSVIDGQQRLLTMWVLLIACRDLAIKRAGKSAAKKAEAQDLRTKFKSYLSNVGHQGRDAWRIVPQKLDESSYRHLMLETREPASVKIDNVGLNEADSSALIEAYNFFLREMSRRRLPAKPPFEMLTFGSLYPLDPAILEYTIMNRLQAIKLVAGANEDPNMIFESLNTKGRDLQQVDLIKNFLYLSLGEDADEVYASYWRPMENVLRPAELERFAWASLVSKGENVLQKRTYEAVQRRLRQSGVAETKTYVIELHTEAVWFERLIRPLKEGNPAIRTAIQDVVAAGGNTALPLILYCYRRFQESSNVRAFTSAMFAIESFLVRRMLAGDSTNNLNSMFGSMCSRLHVDPRFAATDELEKDIKRVLASRPDDWPSDDRVAQGVRTVDFYKTQSARQRIHVLRRVDQYMGKAGVSLDYEVSDKSIEHIAPQDPKAPNWYPTEESEVSELFARIHTLPNLTLLTPAENSSLGRAAWTVKRAKYKTCDYPMTAQIATSFDDAGGWDIARLELRANTLASVVSEIWVRDAIPPHEVAGPAGEEGEASDDASDDDDDEYDESLLEAEMPASDS